MAARRGPLPQWLGFFLLAAVPRLAYLFITRPPFDTTYWALASGLLHDGSLSIDGTRVTDFEPLYPLFLAALRWLARDHLLIVQIGQALVASLGGVYLFRLAHALTGRTEVAAIAASLYALHPLLIRQAAAPADLALATTLLVAFAYYFVSGATARDRAWAGVVLGLAILTRSMIMPLAALVVVVLIAERQGREALALAVVVFMLAFPFVLRNRSVNGAWGPTRSGLNLYIGNSPYTSGMVPDYDLDILEEQAWAVVDRELPRPADADATPEFERAADAILTRQALDYAKDHPLGTLKQKVLNGWYFFSPRLVPFYLATDETHAAIDSSGLVVIQNSARRPRLETTAYSVFYAPVLIGALVGVYWRRRDARRDAVLWCVVATFVAVSAAYYPATRYRAPMEFVLLFYAAVAAHGIYQSYAGRTMAPASATVGGTP